MSRQIDDLDRAFRNLLIEALDLQSSDHLLVVVDRESAQAHPGRLYDRTLATEIVEKASEMVATSVLELGTSRDDLHSALLAGGTRTGVTKVLFHSNVGARLRFLDDAAALVSYVYDWTMMASLYAAHPHQAMLRRRERIEDAISQSSTWSLSTIRSTGLTGMTERAVGPVRSVGEFPVSTFAPINSSAARGKLEIAQWVTSTTHRKYSASELDLGAGVEIEVEAGRIVKAEATKAGLLLMRHLERVGRELSLDPYTVRSWHAGIHPHAPYFLPRSVAEIEAWGARVFGSTRYAHLHVGGVDGPGEVCLSVLDPQIKLDGRVMTL